MTILGTVCYSGLENKTIENKRYYTVQAFYVYALSTNETTYAMLFTSTLNILQLVLALYPQTTCFYRALIHESPKKVGYFVSFYTHNLSVFVRNCDIYQKLSVRVSVLPFV